MGLIHSVRRKFNEIFSFEEGKTAESPEKQGERVLFAIPTTVEEANAVVDFMKAGKGDIFLFLNPKIDPKITFYVKHYIQNEIGKHTCGAMLEVVPEKIYAIYPRAKKAVKLMKTEEGFIEVEHQSDGTVESSYSGHPSGGD